MFGYLPCVTPPDLLCPPGRLWPVCSCFASQLCICFTVKIAKALEGTPAAGQVSKADLVALAGARAVQVCGGPAILVMVGRQDATDADPPGRMASEKSGVEPLKANFADKGFGVKELVVLSGAHTLGASWCSMGAWTLCAAVRRVSVWEVEL